jgi:DNA-binding transcriptional MerR regulator
MNAIIKECWAHGFSIAETQEILMNANYGFISFEEIENEFNKIDNELKTLQKA